jgi:hypothetical protein
VLSLAGINVVGLALFAAAYVAAALRWLSQGAFVASVVVLVGAVTALWVRTERQAAGGRGPIDRLGRAVGGFALVAILGPVGLLTPLFALQGQLPQETGADHVISRIMVLLLASLALVALCNLAGALYEVAVALGARFPRRGGPRAG